MPSHRRVRPLLWLADSLNVGKLVPGQYWNSVSTLQGPLFLYLHLRWPARPSSTRQHIRGKHPALPPTILSLTLIHGWCLSIDCRASWQTWLMTW
jgi:hypothetical protein